MKEGETAADIVIKNLATGFKVVEPILPSRSAIKEIVLVELRPVVRKLRKVFRF